MSIQAIPPELLEHCFSYLPTSSLSAAGHVCRSWWSPVREVQWRRRRIHLTAQTAEKLAVLLGPGTTIPQIVEAICVDEPINDEAIQAFRENVITIMNHFHARSDLVLDNFGLCNLSEGQQQEFLRQARPRRSLIVKWLMANDLSRAMRIVLDQPDISFLGVGLVSVEGPVINDGAEILRRWKEHKVENTENEIASIAVRLGNLRALCLYSAEGPPLDGTHWVVRKVWSHIVPALSRAKLPMLETLVAESPQGTREKLERLICATAATIQSLAASFDDPGNLVLLKMPCLRNLSINLRTPGRGNLGNTGIASALATISSAAATLEHIFLHLTTSPQYRDIDQWQELDAIMAGMPCLRRITIIDYTPGFFGDVLRGQLDVCLSKGLIEVKTAEGRSWSKNAFADYDVGDTENRKQIFRYNGEVC
ncbi:hypothetical protein CGCSCA4_v012921 [Colletotrichum siamense]|uniref:F-box domain-containing protein n=1 Tax=Colletotrichum siamense TaxID=690259 RepID=A0A9P5BSW9_COLSI|nr:hypothetical protein CGCSCA4_v012921 [Colletotrichum siamense]KAF4848750.1 hypothetical protein CGCSCA2_v012220 [Colletotrichum siamense]